MRLERYALADPATKLPMPDRGGRLFSADGEMVDVEHPFWAARIRDGEIVAANQNDDQPARPASNRKGK